MNEKNGLSVYSVIEYFKKQLTIMPTIMPITSIVPSTNISPKPSFTPSASSGYGNNSGTKNTKTEKNVTEKSVDRSVDQSNYESKNNNKNENRKSVDRNREKEVVGREKEVVEEFEPEESSRPILAENKKEENKKENRRNQGSRIPQSSQSVKDLGSNAGISTGTGTGTGVSRVNINVPEAVSTVRSKSIFLNIAVLICGSFLIVIVKIYLGYCFNFFGRYWNSQSR